MLSPSTRTRLTVGWAALVPPLEGIDPDDAFSAVPYEKGLALLNHLTDVVGGRVAFEGFGGDILSWC